MVYLAEENYKKVLKKATYEEEMEEKLHIGVTEDLSLAYEGICDINKALEDLRTEWKMPCWMRRRVLKRQDSGQTRINKISFLCEI